MLPASTLEWSAANCLDPTSRSLRAKLTTLSRCGHGIWLLILKSENDNSQRYSPVKRQIETLLSRPESLILAFLCKRVPRHLTPDHFTMAGAVGGLLAFVGLALSSMHPAYLGLSIAGIIMNWAGDSLDGTLARYRSSERHRYGYFVDHMTDSFTMVAIGVGGGLSPFLSMNSCLAVLIGYLLLTILAALEARVSGVLRISFGYIGPTEFRIFLIAMIAGMFLWPEASLSFGEFRVSVYDAVLVMTAAILLWVCATSTLGTIRTLSREDP